MENKIKMHAVLLFLAVTSLACKVGIKIGPPVHELSIPQRHAYIFGLTTEEAMPLIAAYEAEGIVVHIADDVQSALQYAYQGNTGLVATMHCSTPDLAVRTAVFDMDDVIERNSAQGIALAEFMEAHCGGVGTVTTNSVSKYPDLNLIDNNGDLNA